MPAKNNLNLQVSDNQESQFKEMRHQLLSLIAKMTAAEKQFAPVLKKVHPSQQPSAVNLLHYMALRNVDIRSLQETLHINGLSSLASSESHVRWQVNAVLNRIQVTPPAAKQEVTDFFAAQHKRHERATALFGARKNNDIPTIMVTFDKELSWNLPMVKQLLYSGMNVARINCAHDDESVWQAMVWNIKKAVKTTGIPCKIYMDLAGPKIRTVIKGKPGKKHKLHVQHQHHFTLAETDDDSVEGPVIYCSQKGIIQQLHEGERVLFDDGEVETIIEKMEGRKAHLRVERVSGKKPVIKESKGINFPDSKFTISALTEFDLQCIPFVVKNADTVGFSFVRQPLEVYELQQKLKEHTGSPPGIILKIETLEAVNNLPLLLLQGMKNKAFGVMIARGDLAVEIGIERLSEIQDEILWICEAAHTPAIWATQVLESLNKSGFASRSEGTDAARSVMAECVMINKGAHLIEVLESLKDILKRSGGHRIKKRYLFRPLHIAQRFLSSTFKLY
jgi:pyruvate kinase